MYTKQVMEIYAVRIPSLFLPIIVELQKNGTLPEGTHQYKIFSSLRKLSEYLSMEDVFHFAYLQTDDDALTRLMSDYKLPNMLQHPDNIAWLNEVKNEYDRYVRRLDEEKKLQKSVNTTLFLNERMYGLHDHYQVLREERTTISNPVSNISAVYFLEKNGDDVNNFKSFRFALLHALNNFMGFEALRFHPMTKYSLSLHH